MTELYASMEVPSDEVFMCIICKIQYHLEYLYSPQFFKKTSTMKILIKGALTGKVMVTKFFLFKMCQLPSNIYIYDQLKHAFCVPGI